MLDGWMTIDGPQNLSLVIDFDSFDSIDQKELHLRRAKSTMLQVRLSFFVSTTPESSGYSIQKAKCIPSSETLPID
jgi:hypothetical protein